MIQNTIKYVYTGLILAILIIPQITPVQLDAHHSDGDDEDPLGSLVHVAYSMNSTNSVHYLYNYSYHDAYAHTRIGYCVGHPLCSSWEYEFWMTGQMNATGSYGFPSHGMLQAAAFDISVTDNQDHCIVDIDDNQRHTWCTPKSGTIDHSMDVHIAKNLLELGFGVLADAMGLGLAWSTADAMIDTFVNASYKNNNVNSSNIWYLWEWIPQVNDACQSIFFNAKIDNGNTATISCKYHIFAQGFELLTAGPMTVTLTAPSESNPHLISGMTIEEREQQNIITVTKDNVREYSDILHLTKTETREIESSDKEFFFSIVPFVIEEQPTHDDRTAVIDANSAHLYLESQFERSRMIVDVFGSAMDFESQNVANKHYSMINIIEELLSDLNKGSDYRTVMDDYDTFIKKAESYYTN